MHIYHSNTSMGLSKIILSEQEHKPSCNIVFIISLYLKLLNSLILLIDIFWKEHASYMVPENALRLQDHISLLTHKKQRSFSEGK